jgi:hypothetical protein
VRKYTKSDTPQWKRWAKTSIRSKSITKTVSKVRKNWLQKGKDTKWIFKGNNGKRDK